MGPDSRRRQRWLRRKMRLVAQIAAVAVVALLALFAFAELGAAGFGSLGVFAIGVTVAEMRETRAKHVADARAIYQKAEAEKRELSAEEEERAKKFLDDGAELFTTIKAEEAKEAQRKRLGVAEASLTASQGRRADPDPAGERRDDILPELAGNPEYVRFHQRFGTSEYRACFNAWLARGAAAVTGDAEQRALQADLDVSGGYLIAPEMFVRELIKTLDNRLFFRQLARTFLVLDAESLGAPALDADPEDADWTGEITTADEDTAMTFGRRELKPNYLSKLLKVSNPLMRKAAFSAEELVRDRLAYKIGVPQENAFFNGTGAGQPLGVFTASAQGISTGRDVSTGNEATYPTFDGLKRAKYTLASGYHANASWIFHSDVLCLIALLKDGEGRYIWQPNVTAGEPDRLLNFPVYASAYAPNTMTTGLYCGILGDFRAGYWIADSLAMQIQRLVELYAATNQTGFIVRAETDGMPVLEEAFVRVKLG